ncbi:MAG: ABC transporter ATP-binding protein [Endomicrobiales bacterium]|nr:ABC transporter ATP-binding protein [Endomicrobiales bacterium]
MEILAKGIEKSYFSDSGVEVKALKGVDLSVKTGESIAIIGPSGAGKSTLLHILGLMDRPDGGTLTIDGNDMSIFKEKDHSDMRNQKLGFIFQFHYLLPEFSVWENIILPAWEKREGRTRKAKELLGELGLESRTTHFPSELSGGEQQRVALARALINEPQVLFADEPTGNLDRETGEIVENIMFKECARRRIGLMLVTHNAELAAKAGRIVKMKDGQIVN